MTQNLENHDHNDIALIAAEIIAYLENHQFAADTIDGIYQWWITPQRIQEEQKRVLAALDYLLEKKLIGRQQLPDGSYFYVSHINEEQNKRNKHQEH
jgi:hypothetical protein